jgi:hypothetical protein
VRAVVATAAVAAVAAFSAWRLCRSDSARADRGFGLAAILFLLATVVAPVNIPAWQCFSQRFATPGVALILAVLPFERLGAGSRRVASWGLFVAAAAFVSLSYPMHRRLVALCADAVAGLSAPVHRSGVQLPMALAPSEVPGAAPSRGEVPMLDPLLHMGALYAAVQGGLVPFVYATGAATHPFTLRPGPAKEPVPDLDHYDRLVHSPAFDSDPGYRRRVVDDLASFGMFYEGVVFLGVRSSDVELLHTRGFVADWERATAFVGHFEPCRIDLIAPLEASSPEPVLDVAWGRFVPVRNVQIAATRGSDGLAHFIVPRTPCGDVRVGARWAPSREGGPPRVCKNADADGRFSATVSRASAHVECSGLVDEREAVRSR